MTVQYVDCIFLCKNSKSSALLTNKQTTKPLIQNRVYQKRHFKYS